MASVFDSLPEGYFSGGSNITNGELARLVSEEVGMTLPEGFFSGAANITNSGLDQAITEYVKIKEALTPLVLTRVSNTVVSLSGGILQFGQGVEITGLLFDITKDLEAGQSLQEGRLYDLRVVLDGPVAGTNKVVGRLNSGLQGSLTPEYVGSLLYSAGRIFRFKQTNALVEYLPGVGIGRLSRDSETTPTKLSLDTVPLKAASHVVLDLNILQAKCAAIEFFNTSSPTDLVKSIDAPPASQVINSDAELVSHETVVTVSLGTTKELYCRVSGTWVNVNLAVRGWVIDGNL